MDKHEIDRLNMQGNISGIEQEYTIPYKRELESRIKYLEKEVKELRKIITQHRFKP